MTLGTLSGTCSVCEMGRSGEPAIRRMAPLRYFGTAVDMPRVEVATFAYLV